MSNFDKHLSFVSTSTVMSKHIIQRNRISFIIIPYSNKVFMMISLDHMTANGSKYVKGCFNRPKYKCHIITSEIIKHIATFIFPFSQKICFCHSFSFITRVLRDVWMLTMDNWCVNLILDLLPHKVPRGESWKEQSVDKYWADWFSWEQNLFWQKFCIVVSAPSWNKREACRLRGE